MKVISLLQPWATLVVIGAKKIETRSWNTDYRGPLLIHASVKCTTELKELAKTSPFFNILRGAGYKFYGLPGARKQSDTLPRGAIIGQVELVGTERTEKILESLPLSMYWGKEQELSFGDYSANRYGWYLFDPVQFAKPTPARGSLGLWEFDPNSLNSF